MGFLDGYYQKWHPYNDWKYDQWKANITSREGPQLAAGWGRPITGGEVVYFGSEYDVFTPAGAKIKPEPYVSTPGCIKDSYKIPGVYYDDPVTGKSVPWTGRPIPGREETGVAWSIEKRNRLRKEYIEKQKSVVADVDQKFSGAKDFFNKKKPSFIKAAKFAAGTLALGAILPGEGVSNIAGAAGAIGAYQYLKGSTGLKFGAAAAVYAATKGIASLFSGRDDSYNTIEGLRHGGMAQRGRLAFTEFGSGWDPLRKLANRMFGKGRGNAFKKMTKSKEFREALAGGEVISELGEGLYGKAHLMEATYRGEKFQYVRKNIESSIAEKWAMFGEEMAPSVGTRKTALESEYKALRRLSDRTSPTPYYYSKDTSELYMEFMSGKTLNKMEEVPEHIVAKIRQEAEIAGKRGIFNPDIHRGNILYDEPTGRVAWLDFGLAQRRNKVVKKEEFELMNKAISEKIVPRIKVKQTSPPPMAAAVPEEGFYEDFGDLMSAEAASMPSRPLPVPPNFPSRNKPFTPIPGKDDAYNTLEGLKHGNMAEVGRKARTEFKSGWKTDIITFVKGELTAEEEEAVRYTPHRGVVSTENITSANKKELSLVGRILADINAIGGRASKLLRESSHEVNRIPFEMAYNGGKRHRESAAGRSSVW